MKRIAFLDYVRVFACLLVMVVHASENFYGAAGTGEMAGPQSFLQNEADRFWVSLYDGFSRMSVPLFMIISAYLLVPMKEGQSMWQFYRRRFLRVGPPTILFMLLYSTLPLLWGQIDSATATRDLSRLLLNFPSLAGHLWFMYPLISLYLFIPIISPWLRKATAKEEGFFIALFALSTCMPYLHRWFGELWGECFWNEYHMLWYFSGFLGYLVMAHYIGSSGSRPLHPGHRTGLGHVHHQLRIGNRRHLPALHLHQKTGSSPHHNRTLQTQLRHVPDAHLLARTVGKPLQSKLGLADKRGHTSHSLGHFHQQCLGHKNHLLSSRQQMAHRIGARHISLFQRRAGQLLTCPSPSIIHL